MVIDDGIKSTAANIFFDDDQFFSVFEDVIDFRDMFIPVAKKEIINTAFKMHETFH